MRKAFLFAIAFLFLSDCFAQEITEKKNKLTDSVIERFNVFKATPTIKQGPYKAFFRRRTLIAEGNYTNGNKTGIWSFYRKNGKIMQQYDFDNNTVSILGGIDTTDDLRFDFDVQFTKNDTLTRPFKIGEPYYGYIPYVTLFQLPFNTYGVDTDSFDATVELLISPLGRLAEYKVHVISGYYKYDRTFSLDVKLFSDEDRMFAPAKFNGTKIISRIFIRCAVTPDGGLDFY